MEPVLKLTQEFVRERYVLDTESWTLLWRNSHQRPDRIGKPVGAVDHGYIKIDISGFRFYAHQIIWLYLYGEWPELIDHKDGNGLNNDPSNLRIVTQIQNCANAKRRGNGVEKHGRKYRVRLFVDGVRHTVGSFETLEEAESAYRKAHIAFHGEYSVFSRN